MASQRSSLDSLSSVLAGLAEQRGTRFRLDSEDISDIERLVECSNRHVYRLLSSAEDLGRLRLHGDGQVEVIEGQQLKNADRRGEDLREENLERADLRGAKLQGANLAGVSLRGADLSRSRLDGANLSNADLTGAYLTDAIARGVEAPEANFRDADLTGTNLTDSNLTGVDLVAARLFLSKLRDTRLDGARISAFFDTREGWAQTDIENSTWLKSAESQNNHVFAALRFLQIDGSHEGRCMAARVEAVMFGCYPEIFEDCLSNAPDTFGRWHVGLDEMWQEGDVDWGFYFCMKWETAHFRERMAGRDPDVMMADLYQQILPHDPVIAYNLRASMQDVLPHGFAGLGVPRDELVDMDGSVRFWNNDRTGRYRRDYPEIPHNRRPKASRVMETVDGLEVDELVELAHQRPRRNWSGNPATTKAA